MIVLAHSILLALYVFRRSLISEITLYCTVTEAVNQLFHAKVMDVN
jgi:hypothetical protein